MFIGIPLFDTWGIDPEHHVTVTFNGHGESKNAYLSAVTALAETCRWWHSNGNRRIELWFGETGVFNENCWHAKVKHTGLDRFRAKLVQELDRWGVYHSEDYDFQPHVTLNYGAEPNENLYDGNMQLVTSFAVESRNFGRTEIKV